MRLTFDKSLAFGNQLEIDAINGSQVVPLTSALAAKCGYSMECDPWGNTKLYASLLSCFAQNQDDRVFDIQLRLRMYGNKVSEEDLHEVRHSCEYKQWASREILCERNFMEVSVNRLPPELYMPTQQRLGSKENGFKSGAFSEAPTSLPNVWRMVFYTPKEKPMMLGDVLKAGYGVSTTPSRLVLRSPYGMDDTYSQNVNGVQMEVFKLTTYFKREWSVTMIDTAAACPTGGLHFTDQVITWYMPRYITPLMMFHQHDLLELYMGIDGKRLDTTRMNAMGYTLSVTDSHVIISLPVGGPDGYYKSHALNYEYHTTYSIEPMVELLWREGQSDITRYKVHYPITTPPKAQPPWVVDNTVTKLGFFDVLLGTFLHDVELMNITFSSGVMTVAEANARGINVEQHGFPNGSRTFSVKVPFSDPVVLKSNVNQETTTYTLPLIFGLMILPEYTPFPQPALVETTLQDITLPTMRGTCDEEHFLVVVEYGNQGKNFNIMLGTQDLSADIYTEYGVQENSTHLSMTVPFLANNIVFELAHQSSVRGRLDLLLWDSVNSWHIKNFSLACNFPITMTECFSNGTITALAVKVESAPLMVPSQLALKDPSCKPTFSNSRFAYFSFAASSCGTTRTFYDEVMVYQNEISVASRGGVGSQDAAKGIGTKYQMTVSCYYVLNDTQTLTFFTKPGRNEPFAELGVGELQVRMRLAKDSSYNSFYMEEDYPVVQYLRQPLYFEVELIQSADPQIELVLENCWATVSDGVSTMSWDLIVNGCENLDDRYQTIFHPVALEDRVPYPPHLKHFEVKMFTFVKDETVLRDQIFVHCEAVLCDLNQTDAICKRLCPSQQKTTKRGRRSTGQEWLPRMYVSSGKVVLSTFRSDLNKLLT
ncbi:zona pellucida protein AX 1 [Salminus brasiliensis]|uniref:zona pellucida protein AX 1 n=1 Tax=Salminus brasiliensis TaxID=930266 RepID=UPI003B837F3A